MAFQDHDLSELRDLAEVTVAVATAAELGIYRALADGPAAPEALARRLDLDARAVALLLPVLEEAGLVRRADGGFALTPRARARLADPSSADYAAGGLPHWRHRMESWTRLPEVLRSGEPLPRPPGGRSRKDVARFMKGVAAAPDRRVREVVDACLGRRPGARTVLDLGGGPGRYARGFAARDLEVTLLDTPTTVEHVGRAYDLKEDESVRLVGADFHRDPLPEGPFDVVLLSNVLHIYPPEKNRALLAKVAEATAPGGVAAIAESFRGRSLRAALKGLLMLLRTAGGGAYSEEELAGWLREAGFGDVETLDLDPERQLMTAIRA